MESAPRADNIEAGSDLDFDRHWWRIQRICWIILVLLLIGGLAGIFGHGPLSTTTVHPSGSRVQVRYARLARRETPSLLELRLEKAALASGQVRIRLNRSLFDQLQSREIIPAPQSAELLPDSVRFVFKTDPLSDSAVIYFTESPAEMGIIEAEIAVEGSAPVRFRQFIYP